MKRKYPGYDAEGQRAKFERVKAICANDVLPLKSKMDALTAFINEEETLLMETKGLKRSALLSAAKSKLSYFEKPLGPTSFSLFPPAILEAGPDVDDLDVDGPELMTPPTTPLPSGAAVLG